MGRAVQGLAFEALSVAMCARVGDASAGDVRGLWVQRQVLPEGDPLRVAIERFDEMFWQVRRDPAALSQVAGDLIRAVELRMVPTPPDLDRMDIHG